jgi:hypothetical protein
MKHGVQVGRIRHIPAGNVGLERCASMKHVTQVRRAASIPVGKVGIEGTATQKHLGESGPVRHVPSGQIFVEMSGPGVPHATEYIGKVVHSGYIPIANRVMYTS